MNRFECKHKPCVYHKKSTSRPEVENQTRECSSRYRPQMQPKTRPSTRPHAPECRVVDPVSQFPEYCPLYQMENSVPTQRAKRVPETKTICQLI